MKKTATEKQSASAPRGTEATSGTLAKRQQNNQENYTILEWFSQQGARFVKVEAWNAKVNSPGKQPLEKGWQNKPLTLEEVLPHVEHGGNVGLICGQHSEGLCLLDIDDRLQAFLEHFPSMKDAPIIQRGDAVNRGKIVLRIVGDIPQNKKWHTCHLEFLGTGNQGVIPPSIHPGGAAYELVNANQLALEYSGAHLLEVCQRWTEANLKSPTSDPSFSKNGHGLFSRQTRDFIEFGAGPKTRNNRLFNAACDLAGCQYSQSEAESFLLPIWIRMGKAKNEALATIKSAYSQSRSPANPHALKQATTGGMKTVIAEESEKDESIAFPIFSMLSGMPDLPKVARLSKAEESEAKKAGKFIDEYISFGMKDAPMSPPLFHQSYALAILSTAIARRVFVSVGTNRIYPNLYILMSAPSTLYTKTTGYKSAMKLLETAGLSHMLLPDGVTPQSLITELSNRTQDNFKDWNQDDRDEWQRERLFAGQRAWWLDEAARLLSQFQQKHLADLLPIILRLYECESKIKVSTQIRGRETVRNAYLTICGPTTPAALRPHLKTPDYWTNGLFARFLLVTPDTLPVRHFYPAPFQVPAKLAEHLNKLSFQYLESPQENVLGPVSAPPSIEATITAEVRSRWDNYHAAMFELINRKAVPEKLSSCYGRLHEKAIKIAMLLAASDWSRMAKGNQLIIRLPHWTRAQQITEGYRASLHRMIDDASQPIENDDDELAQKIITKLRTQPNKSMPELARAFHMSTGEKYNHLKQTIYDLIETNVIEAAERKGARGSSATVYRVVLENL